jgi:hypothetical protein
LELLTVYLQARRKLLFDRFREFWVEQERSGTWKRLDRAVDRQLRAAKKRHRAARRAEQARYLFGPVKRGQSESAPRI